MVAASDVIRHRVPMLAEAAGQIADAQVRNMGTIGGSLAHADPAADLPAVTLALGAELRAVGPPRAAQYSRRRVLYRDVLLGARER